MAEPISPEGLISRRNVVKAGITAALGAGAVALIKRISDRVNQPNPQPSNPEVTPAPEIKPEDINLLKASELLKEAGIDRTFATSSPKKMYESNKVLSSSSDGIWKIFPAINGTRLGLGTSPKGEPVLMRDGPTNRPERISGTGLDLQDPEPPTSVHKIEVTQNNLGKKAYVIVGYSSHEALRKIIEANPDAANELLLTIFAHSQSFLNILHLPSAGMPGQVFNLPELADQKAYTLDPHNVPSSEVEGESKTRFDSVSGKITRSDIFVSSAHTKKVADAVGLPHAAVFAGLLANEAYGNAVDTYRITNHLGADSGKYEMGSTCAGWATKVQISQNNPNAFFSQKVLDLIQKLSN